MRLQTAPYFVAMPSYLNQVRADKLSRDFTSYMVRATALRIILNEIDN
jgi:hypothetical protein